MSFIRKIAEDRKNLTIFIMAVLILVLLNMVVAASQLISPSGTGVPAKSPKTLTLEDEKEKQELVYALVENLPSEFMPDEDAVAVNGNAESTKLGTKITKLFESRLSVDELAGRYLKAFGSEKDWSKLEDQTSETGARYFDFQSRERQFTVTIEKVGDHTELFVTYYPRLSYYYDPLRLYSR